jgi:hypothetical protein
MNPGIFMPSTEDLGRLSPPEAVQVFRKLLWAKATALSIAKNLIEMPGSVAARMLHCKTRPHVCGLNSPSLEFGKLVLERSR